MPSSPNPRTLKSIRSQRLLSKTELADFTGIALSSIKKFERGERTPTYKQVTGLAAALGVPSFQLYWDKSPELEPLPADFRKVRPTPADLTPRGLRVLFRSERVSNFVRQLIDATGFRVLNLDAQTRRRNSPEARARYIREVFDDWHMAREEKLAFSGDKAHRYLGALKLFFEVHGRLAQVNDAPTEDFFGFYLKPRSGVPTIFVNRKVQSKKSQLFTFCHEYYHYYLQEEGVSNPFRARNNIERQCNQFAAEFIAPEKLVVSLYDSAGRTNNADKSSLVRYVSSNSLLSMHASAIRLRELEFVSERFLRSWISAHRNSFEEEKIEEKGDGQQWGPPHAKSVSEIGHLPFYLSIIALREKAVDAIDISESLGVSLTLQEKSLDLARRRIEAAID